MKVPGQKEVNLLRGVLRVDYADRHMCKIVENSPLAFYFIFAIDGSTSGSRGIICSSCWSVPYGAVPIS